jgi:hypothetical protein
VKYNDKKAIIWLFLLLNRVCFFVIRDKVRVEIADSFIYLNEDPPCE